jgi:hypothetical protein
MTIARAVSGVLFVSVTAFHALAQTPATTPPNPAAPAGPAAPSSGGTFSMETEIFAYRALQSDVEAIACDVSGFINGSARPPDDKGSCAPAPDGTGNGLIIVSSTTTIPASFQIWRANMAVANELLSLAKQQGCPASGQHALDFVSTAPVVVSLIQGVVGLFATSQSSVGVQGSIQDQALMSRVARQLRGLKFRILMPDVYPPFTFGGLDYTNSPFLVTLQNLITQRSCLNAQLLPLFQKIQDNTQKKNADQEKLKAQPSPSQADQAALKAEIDVLSAAISTESAQIVSIQSVIAGIDGFVASLAGAPAPAAPAAGATTPGPTPTPPSPTPTSPIVTVLIADGLARAIGVQPDGSINQNVIWRVLALKALESGGALITETNALGQKVHFSGGAAATYSLFDLNRGELGCSGNAVAYSGYVLAKASCSSRRCPAARSSASPRWLPASSR